MSFAHLVTEDKMLQKLASSRLAEVSGLSGAGKYKRMSGRWFVGDMLPGRAFRLRTATHACTCSRSSAHSPEGDKQASKNVRFMHGKGQDSAPTRSESFLNTGRLPNAWDKFISQINN
jgi:hypothetical protein